MHFITRVLLLLVLLSSASLAHLPFAAASQNATPFQIPVVYDAILDDQVEAIYAATAYALPTYTVSAILNSQQDGTYRVEGELDLEFVNLTGKPISSVPMRLYPNYPAYIDGEMTFDSVMVDGAAVDSPQMTDLTLVQIPLPEPLAAGGRTTISIDFETVIPVDPPDTYGMFEFDTIGNTLSMAHWLPLVTGWDSENGWNLEPVDTRGDPVFTNAALFDITLEASSDLTFATSGSEIETTDTANSTIHRWVSGPSRDFVMIASSTFAMESATVNGTTVRSFFVERDRDSGMQVLDTAVESIRIYSQLLGPYPYKEFDVVQARLGSRAAGIEFPGLVFIGADLYEPDNSYLAFTVTHEVGHQWWYNVVGNNQYQHAFLDESLTNYLATVYVEFRYGPDAAQSVINAYLKRPYFAALFGSTGDEIVDQPTADFISDRSYGRIVYGKGALGFQAIRAAIGDEAFFTGLTNYAAAQAFDVALPVDLQTALERASGDDLGELWRHWFLAAEGNQDFTIDDLEELVQG